MNKKLFMCLFLSAIIATEVGPSLGIGEKQIDYNPNTQQLSSIENQPSIGKENINNNRAETETKQAFSDSMCTTEAKNGWTDMKYQWNLMLEGPEASRMITQIGENLYTVFSTENSTKFINTVIAGIHIILSKIGNDKNNVQLEAVMQMIFKLATSPNITGIIDKTNYILMIAVNNENTIPIVKELFKGMNEILDIKKVDKNLDNIFRHIRRLMKEYVDKNKTKVTK